MTSFIKRQFLTTIELVFIWISAIVVHCKFLPHENYGDWELQSP